MRTPPALLATLAGCAVVFGACTSSTTSNSASDFQGPQKAVAQVVDDFSSAGSDRDANKICEEFLAPSLIQAIQKASKTTCSNALDNRLDDADSFKLDVDKITINGDQATVTVTSDVGGSGDGDRRDTLQLQRIGNNWKIAQLS